MNSGLDNSQSMCKLQWWSLLMSTVEPRFADSLKCGLGVIHVYQTLLLSPKQSSIGIVLFDPLSYEHHDNSETGHFLISLCNVFNPFVSL